MAPRGLSADEKRVKLLEIFHETKDFYQLKELEKLGPKMKGIVSQSVKEVLQSLVDDGLVQADKIGSSNFFWSFPSQQGAIIQNRLAKAKETRTGYQDQLAGIRKNIDSEKTTRPESVSANPFITFSLDKGATKNARSTLLGKLSIAKEKLSALEKELGAYGECDPAKLEEKKRAIFLAREASLRWTDNYGMLLGYFTRQTGIDASEIRKYLDIDEEYEDIC
ncbi:meiotic nuclear division protein 1 [Infundibulicybe gibba]|nr:meiotic nuclear division protein 1 [Infundibulicybe gibba]